MAISALAVWEVRPSTGSDTNGGGFVPGSSGTDWSQQASPQYSVTDGVAVGSTTITSATAAFGTDVVGNIMNVGGVWRQIVSRTNSTTIVVDANVSTATGLTIKIGGAFATVSQAASVAQPSNQIYFKGTYSAAAALNFALQSDFAVPSIINGYGTARDDGTRAVWTTATNSINLLNVSNVQNAWVKNIDWSNTAGTKGTGASGNAITQTTNNSGGLVVSQCSFDGFNNSLGGDWSALTFTFVNLQLDCVEFKNSVSHAVLTTGSTISVGCWFHGNGGDGFRIATIGNNSADNYTCAFSYCVFYANTGNGLTNLSTQIATQTVGGNTMVSIVNCAFVSNGGDGVNGPASHTGTATVWNNIFYGNTGFGWNSPTSNALVNSIPRCNAFGANGSGARNNFPIGIGDFGLSSDPFVSKSTGNFALNSLAGGGTLCKGTGFGAFAFGTGSVDVGAVPSGAAGGAQTLVISQQHTNYIVREDPWY